MAINSFLDDLRRVMMRKNIQRGSYSLTSGTASQGQGNYTSGHINPMLGMGARNTKTETLRRIEDNERM